uniref:Jacalin-domain protein n=1 Tax=Solanum tuberosum TaxID=4113 RepID=M0ZRU1_SOLTU
MDRGEGSEIKKRIVIGSWGGHGGSPWDDGSFNGVREISLVYSLCIDSITVVYDQNGQPYQAEKHGGVGGSRTAQVTHFSTYTDNTTKKN